MKAHSMWRGGLAGTVVVLATAVVFASATVRITPVLADEQVLATFAAPTVFSADVREAVQSGISVSLEYTIALKRSSTLWFDKALASVDVASTVKFDMLTGAYHVSKVRDGAVHWSQQTQKEDDMRLWMTEFERVPLTTLAAMAEPGEYYIQVRARDTLPRGFSLWPFGRDGVSGKVEVPTGR
jgi:hypothetical protein